MPAPPRDCGDRPPVRFRRAPREQRLGCQIQMGDALGRRPGGHARAAMPGVERQGGLQRSQTVLRRLQVADDGGQLRVFQGCGLYRQPVSFGRSSGNSQRTT